MFINEAHSYTCEFDLPLLWNVLIASNPVVFQPRVLQVIICTSMLEDLMVSGIRCMAFCITTVERDLHLSYSGLHQGSSGGLENVTDVHMNIQNT